MTAVPALPAFNNLRVLCFDDKPSQRESTRSLLEEQAPITVDFAVNKVEANQHITDSRYDVVLVDVDLRDTEGAEFQGDDWLREQLAELRRQGVEPYIVTAQKGMIRDWAWIRENRIDVIEKGPNEKAFYNRLRHRALGSVPRQFAERPPFEFVTTTPEQEVVAKMILDRTLGAFYEWIERLPDSDVKDLYVSGADALSPRDIKNAMRDPQSALGMTMVALFVDHIRDILGLDREDE